MFNTARHNIWVLWMDMNTIYRIYRQIYRLKCVNIYKFTYYINYIINIILKADLGDMN